MARQIVRQSKFRHVFGELEKLKYEELKISSKATESTGIKGNSKFWAVSWETGGGGSVLVMPNKAYGRVTADVKLIRGHTGGVLDLDFNPFHDGILSTASEDGFIKVWGIPNEGLTEDLTQELARLEGHTKKVSFVTFHPCADHLLASASFDQTVRVWNVMYQQEAFCVQGHSDSILALQWNFDGSSLATTCKDRQIRLIDPRSATISAETKGHEGSKSAKVCWLGDSPRIFTCGFSKSSERQYAFWDIRNFSQPLVMQQIDQAAGVIMPFYDPSTKMLLLAGKGDGNMRYFEVDENAPYCHYVDDYRSNDAGRGAYMLPKHVVDTSKVEIFRVLKLCNTQLQVVSFRVPRRGDLFQEDLYPDCAAPTAALTADEWVAGLNKPPVMVSLNPSTPGGQSLRMSAGGSEPTSPNSGVAHITPHPSNPNSARSSATLPVAMPSSQSNEALLALLAAKDARIAELEALVAKLSAGK